MQNDPTRAAAEGVSKFTGPGRYLIESFDCERIVYLDPLPEPQASFLTGWAKLSNKEVTRATDSGDVWIAPEPINRIVIRKIEEC